MRLPAKFTRLSSSPAAARIRAAGRDRPESWLSDQATKASKLRAQASPFPTPLLRQARRRVREILPPTRGVAQRRRPDHLRMRKARRRTALRSRAISFALPRSGAEEDPWRALAAHRRAQTTSGGRSFQIIDRVRREHRRRPRDSRSSPSSARPFTIALHGDGCRRPSRHVLRGIEAGEIEVVAVDLPLPSPLALEILTARPYAYLDDARSKSATHASGHCARRWLDPETAAEWPARPRCDPSACGEEAWPEARNADELHDALLGLSVS